MMLLGSEMAQRRRLSANGSQPAVAGPWLLVTLLLASAVSVGWAAWDVYGPGPVALRDRPIQNVRVGVRVWGANPNRAEYARSFPEPEAKTWQLLRLVMHKPDGDDLRIELLRPTTWLTRQGATVGCTLELGVGQGDILLFPFK